MKYEKQLYEMMGGAAQNWYKTAEKNLQSMGIMKGGNSNNNLITLTQQILDSKHMLDTNNDAKDSYLEQNPH